MTAPRLRIAIFGLNYAPEPTGIAPYTTKLAERLAAEGHDVRVITGYPHYPEWKVRDGYSGWKKDEILNGVRVKRLRHFVPTHVKALQRIHMELSFGVRLLFSRWNDPDVVLVITPALFSSAMALLRARFGWNRPATGIWVQDIYSRGLEETGTPKALVVAGMKELEGRTLRLATKVTVIHGRFKDYITSSLEVPAVNVSIIRNWTHIDPLTSIDRPATRVAHGWADSEIVVVHAGNMGAKQALENVVEAARLADISKSNVRFVLLGDGHQRSHIENLSSGIERLQFIMPLPEKEFTSTIASADILLVNEKVGLREMAVPSKLTSYFSTGVVVVAATEPDSTTASELERSGAGIRIDPGSPRELLKISEQLGADPHLCTELGGAGIRYARDVLSHDAAIIQYTEWLEELVAVKPGRRRSTTAQNIE